MGILKSALPLALAALTLTACQTTTTVSSHSESTPHPRAGLIGDNPHLTKRMPIIRFDNEVLLVRSDYDLGLERPQPVVPQQPLRTYVLQSDLLFDFDKSTLKPEGHDAINQLITDVVENYELINIVTVSGHTDRFGSEQYNIDLSQRRAETVRAELINRGFEPRDIAVRAFGESMPITDGCHNMDREAAKKCLAPDRRVEIEINGLIRPEPATAPQEQTSQQQAAPQQQAIQIIGQPMNPNLDYGFQVVQ